MKNLLRFALLLAGCFPRLLCADTVLVFNEIMYHPSTNDQVMEWVELRNQMAVDVDISGWSISGDIQYTFPSNSIVSGGGFVVVAASPADLMAATGLTNVAGPFLGQLSNKGNPLRLRNNSGILMDELSYGSDGDWPVAPDGSGVSLAKLDRESASAPAENWTSSEQVGGTPGADNFPFFNGTPPDSKIFAVDASWKYNDSGSDLGSAWRDSSYDDSLWGSRAGITNRTIPGLFNTGVDPGGAGLPQNTVDPHYVLTVGPAGPENTNALAILNHPSWLANDSVSSWIGVFNPGSSNVSAGDYNYQTTFSLSGFLLSTLQLNVSMAADNRVTNVFLNGLPTGLAYVGFAALSGPMLLNSGFQAGGNTLEFRTVNDGTTASPHGFRAVLSGTGLAATVNPPLASGATTYYFRKSFFFRGDPAYTHLNLNPLVADGAVFYLNGVEVYRQNLPAGPIDYSTPALSAVPAPAFTGSVPISASNLVAGINVLTAEVHLAAGNAGPVLLGAELFSTPLPEPQTLVAFNELSSSTNSEFWLELINHGTNSLLLDGCVLYHDGNGTNNHQYTFPPNNLILAPGAYLALTNDTFGLNPSSGDRLYLYSATRSHVFDSVVVKKAPRARFPEGTGPWLYPDVGTPGGPNSFAFHREIVINEIMFQHAPVPGANGLPPQDSPEQWIELFNRGTNSVDLTGWQVTGGIGYSFSPGKSLGPGSYLVIAKDSAALRLLYPGIDIVGDYSGNLSGKSDLLVLQDPIGNPANQLRYYDGAPWPEYSNGGGSSLELRDPNADNSKPGAWAASDESHKSPWQTNSYRMVATIPAGSGQPTNWNDFVFGLLGWGECLIDDLSVIDSPASNPVQLIANGDFENNLSGWRAIGTHTRTRVEVDPDNPGNHVLHVISSGPQEHKHNHIEQTLLNGIGVTNGHEYQISYRTRWIAGNNFLNTRLYFNRCARTVALPMPTLNGTPGAANSRLEPNLGPTFSQFQHHTVVPQPGEPVTVSVVAQDPQGVATCQVWWSVNGGSWVSSAMTNLSGGPYLGTIPGYPAGSIVQFYVRAVDGLGAASTYPLAGPDSGALYTVADGQANLALGHNIRIILTPANVALLHADTNVESNDKLPVTIIYDENRAYYDSLVRLRSSERGRYTTNRLAYHIEFPADDLFRGVHPCMIMSRSGAGDSTANKQEEILVKHIVTHAGNIPEVYTDICRVIAPVSTVTGPAQFMPRHKDEFIGAAYPNGGQGIVWKFELVYYPTTSTNGGYKRPQPDAVIGTDIGDLGNDKEIYRYNFIIKNHREIDDYTHLINFAKAFSQTNTSAQLDAATRQVMDLDQWMRAWTILSLCGIGDTYTFGNNHNLILYQRPSDQKILPFLWDMSFAFNRTPANSAALVGDQNLSRIINLPSNLRVFYGHMLDIIGSSFNTNYMSYWASHYGKFCPGQDFTGALPYIQARSDYAKSVINSAGGNSPFALSGTNFITATNNLITLGGSAPVQVRTIKVNGEEVPVTWGSVSGWTFQLPVSSATNLLTIEALDMAGNVLSNLTQTATVNYTGPLESPQGKVVFNEIMYNPVAANAQYVELFNTSSNLTFDLTSWRINGLAYTFPPGSFLGPRSFMVLAKDRLASIAAYGTNLVVFDEYNGTLQTNGETLTLIQPGVPPSQDVIINKVRYANTAPWPLGPNGGGYSLQLIDAAQDNARVSNWSDGAVWRFLSRTGSVGSATSLAIFNLDKSEVYIDDISLANTSTPGVNLLTNGGFEAPLSGTWDVPANMIGSGASAAFSHSGTYSLHVVNTNAGSAANNAIRQGLPSGLTGNYILSYWYLGTSLSITNFKVQPTPLGISPLITTVNPRIVPNTVGTSNSVAASLPPYPLLWINEVQSDNLTGPIDNVGQHDPWIELYNAGTNALALDGYFLANNYTNLAQWSFPTGTVINPGEFKVIFADGETNQTTATELHTSFRPSSGTGSITLSRTLLSSPQVVDYLDYSGVATNHSYGSFPDGQPFDRQEFYYVTPGGTNNGAAAPLVLFINEWMASNTRTLVNTNNANKYDDWFELYNPTTNHADLAGYYLTDTLTDPFHFRIPNGYSVPPGGYLLVWADNASGLNNSNRPDLHVNFNLNKSGEAIGLYAADGTRIDAVTFGVQTSDVSEGRCSDGATNRVFLHTPTPRAANACPAANTAPVLAPIGTRVVHQDQTLSFTASATDAEAPPQTLTFSLGVGAPAGANITSGGLFTWPTTGVSAPSTNLVTVRVADDGTPSMEATEVVTLIVLRPLSFGQLSRAGAQLTLTWETIPGQTYRVEYKDNLNDAEWTLLPGSDQTAVDSSLSATVDMSDPLFRHRFYRIGLVQ